MLLSLLYLAFFVVIVAVLWGHQRLRDVVRYRISSLPELVDRKIEERLLPDDELRNLIDQAVETVLEERAAIERASRQEVAA